jgi:hypothetical protein
MKWGKLRKPRKGDEALLIYPDSEGRLALCTACPLSSLNQELAMKIVLAAIILCLSLVSAAQTNPQSARVQPQAAQPVTPDLNIIMADLQRVALATSGDIGKLRIEKWKADSAQKQQMQQVADSLQKNIVNAIPGLINDVQTSHGAVSKTFKLYHNINVVYEFLNSLAEAAGAFGKKEEYEPLATDAASLDNVRQILSSYIEQTATRLETTAAKPSASSGTQSSTGPKKIVIDDSAPSSKKKKKSTKKKTSPPPDQQ